VQLARLEAEDAALAVGEREQQPPLEVVVAALAGQSGCAQFLLREALAIAFRASELPPSARPSRNSRLTSSFRPRP